jgi:hypothetical protein
MVSESQLNQAYAQIAQQGAFMQMLTDRAWACFENWAEGNEDPTLRGRARQLLELKQEIVNGAEAYRNSLNQPPMPRIPTGPMGMHPGGAWPGPGYGG